MTILEASDRIGGRVCDDYTISGCGFVTMGAMFVTGVMNNPFSFLVKQCEDTKLLPINEDICELLLETGTVAPPTIDKRIEKNYNLTLDKLSEWRNSSDNNDDTPLIGILVH